jgi:hypothetical protein
VRPHGLISLALLVCACPGDTAATVTATTGSTGAESSSDTTSPELPTGGDDPGTDSSDTGAPTNPTTDTGDPSTGADIPAGDCPETFPAPNDCGDLPEVCGGATPIAGGPTVVSVQSPALTRDHVWFRLGTTAGCSATLYRVAKSGGDAHRDRSTVTTVDFEADDDAVYFVDKTDDPYTMRVSARVDGVETVLGETHGDPRFNTYFSTFLTRTLAGVVTYDSGGAKHPPFALLTPTALTVVGFEMDEVYLGSDPAYDGQHLFYSLADPPFDDDEDHVNIDEQLIARANGSSVVLAENATARHLPTVAVDGEYVYFATGDPSKHGQPPAMGISRIAKSGGPATPLFPSTDQFIDKVLVDDTRVYFHLAPHDIYAVEKSGGTPWHVWHGALNVESARIQQDADNLYFAVDAGGGDIPAPGREFIVRVAKDAVIP